MITLAMAWITVTCIKHTEVKNVESIVYVFIVTAFVDYLAIHYVLGALK